jgi:hypothetical protein
MDRKPQQSASIFQRTEQPELEKRQLTPVPAPLEPAQRKSNLIFMQPPVQALAVQTPQGLGGWAGL